MDTAATRSNAQIFVLSHARTGSTVLRYVIDAHPDVCCPAELALGRLCRDLSYTIGLTLGGGIADEAERQAVVRAAVRSHVDAIMNAYCTAKQKKRWCDKSTNNVDHLTTIDEIFPDAYYVCLHRDCLDVVHSLLELFRYGYPGRYGQAVARTPENVVDAMIDTWQEATENLLDFESAHPRQCVRVKYEDFVTAPAAIAAQMFAFLDLAFEPRILDAAFSLAHDGGPGDPKIQFTSTIMRGRIGKGSTVPRRLIAEDRLAKVNALHQKLGYNAVTRDGGRDVEAVLRAPTFAARRPAPQVWG